MRCLFVFLLDINRTSPKGLTDDQVKERVEKVSFECLISTLYYDISLEKIKSNIKIVIQSFNFFYLCGILFLGKFFYSAFVLFFPYLSVFFLGLWKLLLL